MSVTGETVAAEQKQRKSVLTRFTRPALGIILPLLLALGWELAVRAGFSTGRLVPPPSVIFSTFAELAKTGELQRHALATLGRVAAALELASLWAPYSVRSPAIPCSCGASSIQACRHYARFRRSRGCRSSSCGSAFSRR